MPPGPGTRLGSYDIVCALGAGGMGEVYRARDTKLNRDVAIKVLLPAVANDPDRLARFKREALVLAALNHPNIAHVYGLEESGGASALVMELVEGETLAERIARGPIPLDEALPIARQIAEALEAAHEQGIIHRDLKPANVKITPAGIVKVLDFGLAKLAESAGSPSTALGAGGQQAAGSAHLSMSPTITSPAMMTGAGMILGTAAYMAPEQAKGRAADRRSDIWAFGCVLFEMLTGRRAFEGDDVADVLAAILMKPPDWSALPASTPALISRLLRRCLEKDRRRRLDSAVAVRMEIDEALATPGGEQTVHEGHAHWSGARLAWLAAAVAAVATLGISARHFTEVAAAPPPIVRFSVAAPAGAKRADRGLFAISPDGRTVAFGATGDGGVTHIFTRHLDQTEAQVVAGTENATGPFWSPDGRSIGFSKAGGLYRTDLDGNAPRRLCDVSGGAAAQSGGGGGTWGTQGVIVFSSPGVGLQRVSDTGGAPSPVTTLDAAKKEVSHASPVFLPDGRHVLFLSLASGQVTGVIWAVSIDDPARTRIVDSSGGAGYADGWLLTTTGVGARTLVAQPFDPDRLTLGGTPRSIRDRISGTSTGGLPGFSVASNGTLLADRPPSMLRQLTWMDRTGRLLSTIGSPGAIGSFALAPDETRAVAEIDDVDSRKPDLWLLDSERTEGTRLTFQAGGNARRPMWALDGRHVFFTSFTKTFELQTLAVGATAPQRFDYPGGFIHFEDLTRDGRYLVFTSLSAPSAVWIERVDVPSERRALVQDRFFAAQPRVSPDGRWLAFTLDLPGAREIFVQPFDRPGVRVQVSRGRGIGAIWRADSRELYYEGPDGLMAVGIAERSGAFSAGTPQKLFPLHTQGLVGNQPHNVEVAANGQKFLVNAIVGDSDNVPLEVTLNWTAGLKK